MITEICIKNLRSIKDSGTISLRPIMILLGANSSGKSTFLRSFPLFTQSVDKKLRGPIAWFDTSYVDYGDFKTAKNRFAEDEEGITFCYRITNTAFFTRRVHFLQNIERVDDNEFKDAELSMVGAFLWVVSPLAAVALPTIAWRMLSSNSSYWLSTWHYSLVLMPIVFMALLDVLVRVHEHRRRVAASAHDKAAADQNTAYQKPEQQNTAGSDWAKPYRNATQAIILKTPLWLVPLLALVFTVAPILTAQPTQPLAQLTDPVFTTTDQTSTEVNKRRAVDAVPIGASVATDLSIITELIPGRTVYWIGHHGEPAPDYVVIDRAGTAWGGKPPTNAAQYAADRYGHPYEVAERVGTIDIVRRTDK